MDKYIGKHLDGRYEIRELIGVGGMANVYKAFDLVENRPVAVKVLRDEYMANEEFLRRFRNESKAVATLSHPNIVQIYDVSFSQKMYSIVMEFIDGITLKEFADQQERIGWKETVHFVIQILRALQHAHDNGIVHRDIKPQNIMLLTDGTIKVTDFGIARFARSNTKTISDRAIGSVHYISPEQAQCGVIDEKTDIYSVGVLMYEMLTGKLPFDAESPISVALKQIQMEPTRPTLLNSEIPQGLEAITMRAMQKDPSRRYQSAAEMLRDIDDFKHNPSIHFAYKYLNEPNGRSASGGNNHVPEPTQNVPETPSEEEYPPRIPFVSMLTGITAAFVLVSALFVGAMFYMNNPFTVVTEIDTPDLVGMKHATVKYDALLIENDIRIYPEATTFNNKYANGVIFEQDPKPGRPIKQGGTIRVKVSAGEKKITLMDLAGMESNEAIALLKGKGIESYEETSIYDDTVPEGYIVKTDPSPNTQLDTSMNVMLYVSMGRENMLVKIPRLVGMNVNDAKRVLKNVQIKIGKTTQVESDAEAGIIVGQYPEAETMVPQGSSIEVEISGGETPEDMTRLRIPIELPPIRSTLSVEAYLGAQQVYQESLTPGVAAGDTNWSKIYEGAGLQKLVIRVNGILLYQFEVDFDTHKHRIVTDNLSLFANGLPESGAVPEEEEGPVEETPDDETASRKSNTSSRRSTTSRKESSSDDD